jgi:hypothetical protein
MDWIRNHDWLKDCASLVGLASNTWDGCPDLTWWCIVQCAAGVFPVAPAVYTSYAPVAAAVPPVAPLPSVAPMGAALPMAPNVYQYPTVWSGDHVVMLHIASALSFRARRRHWRSFNPRSVHHVLHICACMCALNVSTSQSVELTTSECSVKLVCLPFLFSQGLKYAQFCLLCILWLTARACIVVFATHM